VQRRQCRSGRHSSGKPGHGFDGRSSGDDSTRSDVSRPQLRQLEGMPALQHFAIRQAEWLPQRMPRLLAAVAACRRLRSLHLVDCALTTEVLRDIRATAHVEVLDLRDNPKLFPGNAGAIVPEAWAQLAACKSLDVSGCGYREEPTAEALSQSLSVFARMPALQDLALVGAQVMDAAGAASWAGMLNGMHARHGLGGPPVEVALASAPIGALPCSIA